MPRTRGAQKTNVILAIDTATPAVTAGVVRLEGVEVLAERVTVDARAHAEQLTPNVLAALADAGLTVNDLDAVVVGCGPGPFTGLRVGMATAAAYGHALGVPVHGVCSLDAIGVESGATTSEILVVTDARRREVYWARYRDGVRVDGPAVDAPADVPADAQAVAGSPEHAALFDLPTAVARLSDGVGPGARRRRLDGRAGAVGSAVSAPSRRQTRRRWPDDGRVRLVDPPRRRPMRGAGGPAVRRRRPVAGAGVPGGAGGEAHPLRRRPRRRQARRLRRDLPARPKARLTSTRFIPSGWTPRTRAKASAGG